MLLNDHSVTQALEMLSVFGAAGFMSFMWWWLRLAAKAAHICCFKSVTSPCVGNCQAWPAPRHNARLAPDRSQTEWLSRPASILLCMPIGPKPKPCSRPRRKLSHHISHHSLTSHHTTSCTKVTKVIYGGFKMDRVHDGASSGCITNK